MSRVNAATLTILVLAMEEQIPRGTELYRKAACVVNMAIASTMIGLPWGDSRSAFAITIEILNTLIELRPLSTDFARVIETAVMRWETGPRIMRERVSGVRLAYQRRRQHERANGN